MEAQYTGLAMTQHETLTTYYQRFSSYLAALKEAHLRVGNENEERMPNDKQRGIKFIYNLNSEYEKLKTYYREGIKEWPENLHSSYVECAKYRPEKRSQIDRQNIFAATKGRGKGRGRGGKEKEKEEKLGYGDKPVTCFRCNVKGHYSNECKEDVDKLNIKKAVEEVSSKQVK
jgi:hypothetical protein